MSKMKGSTCMILLLSVALLALTLKPPTANGLPGITVEVMPTEVNLTPENATEGFLFNMTVWISGTENFSLMMWQVAFTYNDAFINFTRAWPNLAAADNWDPDYVFYGQGGMAVNPAYSHSLYMINESGITLGHTLLGNVEVPANTPKKVCIVEMNVTSTLSPPLTCGLAINYPSDYGSYFYDLSGPLTVSLVDATYEYTPEPMLLLLSVLIVASVVVAVVFKVRKGRLELASGR